MKSEVKQNAGKMPAFQFYPGDWRKDPGVQALDYETRGIWIEILCLMHESDERGVLLLNGRTMPVEALARLLGLTHPKLNKHLTKLLDHGVIRRRDRDGALYSKRMVADEHLLQVRREAGKLGGNPLLLNQKDNQTPNQKPTPSSSTSVSSSSSISTSIPNTPHSPPKGAGGLSGLIEVERLTHDDDSLNGHAPRLPDQKTETPTTTDPRYAEMIEAYQVAWKAEFSDQYPYQKADGIRLATFLKTSQLDLDQLMTAVTWCWEQIQENGNAAWAVKQALTLRGFCANYPAILAEHISLEAREASKKRR